MEENKIINDLNAVIKLAKNTIEHGKTVFIGGGPGVGKSWLTDQLRKAGFKTLHLDSIGYWNADNTQWLHRFSEIPSDVEVIEGTGSDLNKLQTHVNIGLIILVRPSVRLMRKILVHKTQEAIKNNNPDKNWWIERSNLYDDELPFTLARDMATVLSWFKGVPYVIYDNDTDAEISSGWHEYNSSDG